MHKNIKSSVSFFMSFLMFCQIGGYSGAKAPKDVKTSGNLSFGQKVEAFFKTTIPNHPGETAGVCGGVGLLTAIAIALKIKKPWRHKEDQSGASGSPEIENESEVELPDGDTGGKNKADGDGALLLLGGQPVERASSCPVGGVWSDESEQYVGRSRANSEGGSPREILDGNSSTSTDGTGSVAPTEEVGNTDDVGQRDGGVPETKGENQDVLPSQSPTVSTTVPTVTPNPSASAAADPSVYMPPVVRVPSPQNLPPSVLPQPPAVAPTEPRSPSPDEPKQNEELQIKLSSGVTSAIGQFGRDKRTNPQQIEHFVRFLAKIEPGRTFDPNSESFSRNNVQSCIENNAARCMQAYDKRAEDPLELTPLPERLASIAFTIEGFKLYLQNCGMDRDRVKWGQFKMQLLHTFDVVTDGSDPNKKIVKLKTEIV